MATERRLSGQAEDAALSASAQAREELQKAWTNQQKKSFTLWVNGHLKKAGMKIEDIAADFHDGKALQALLEVISGEKLPKMEKGKMRVHMVNNVQKCLDFIKTVGVRLHGIGAEEIVDGNLKMILGMVWTIILRFAIQDISVEELSAKEGLLLWCQKKTAPYNNVNVQNFHMSFKDGLAFCALIHRHRPDLIPNYSSLKRDNARENLQLAFDVAEQHLDIPQMLDAEDISSCIKPDERAVMTYVSAYYHAFSSFQQVELAAKRIADVFDVSIQIKDAEEEIQGLTNNLLEWIKQTIEKMNNRDPSATSADVHEHLNEFRGYQEKEKPPKAEEKGSIEAKHTTLSTKLRIHNRQPYVPPQGQSLQEIDAAWSNLEMAEGGREDFLHSEIKRLERCEQLFRSLSEKANLHNCRVAENEQVVASTAVEGSSLADLVAMKKRHEAFVSVVNAHRQRVSAMEGILSELGSLQYSKEGEAAEVVASVKAAYAKLDNVCQEQFALIEEELKKQMHIDGIRLEFAKRAGPFRTSLANAKEDLLEPYLVHSVAGVEELIQQLGVRKQTVAGEEAELKAITELNNQLQELCGSSANPYTNITVDDLNNDWTGLQGLFVEQEAKLQAEKEHQQKNDEICIAFANQAGSVEQWIVGQREKFNAQMAATGSTLEEQIVQLNALLSESTNTELFDGAEAADAAVVEARITENSHTKLSMQMLRVQAQQLKTMISNSINAIENQILVRNASGISDEQMEEYKQTFAHFDKDNSGQLDRNEFKACLLATGYQLGENAEEGVDKILASLNKTLKEENCVPLDDFLHFMTSQAAADDTAENLEANFKILAREKDYIHPDTLRSELKEATADYIIGNLRPCEDASAPEGSLDYKAFLHCVFKTE